MTGAPRRPRIGVMGGTFDPIHHGHLVAASEVAQSHRARRGHLRPHRAAEIQVGRHAARAPLPHDGDRHGVESALHREPRRHRPAEGRRSRSTRFATSAIERPDADLFFITGADAIAQILAWKDVDELWDLAHFVAVSRPGHVLSVSGLPEQDVSLLEVPALAISSTDCRSRVRRGFPVWYLVPDGVVQYISKHHLYRSVE